MNTTPFWTILRNNILIIIALIAVSIGIYLNSLPNEFAVVDDLFGYVKNDQIRNVWGSIKTLNIQTIIYAIVYQMVGVNPLPLRIFAVLNHAIVSILIFFTIFSLFDKKTAIIAAFLFAVHPVNSEAVDWVSAQFYILMNAFVFGAILLYLAWRRTKKTKYLYGTAAVFGFYVLFFHNPWVLIIPPIIGVIDYFILNRGFDKQFYLKFLMLLAPILLLYFIFTFSSEFQKRTATAKEDNKILVNEQSIIPILEGYPYSLYSMFRLYLFPRVLTIYYDGNPVTTSTKILMYVVFLLYAGALYYSYHKDKKVLGLLLLLPICIAPVFSPIKITWYITERYLYFGTGFFTALLAVLLVKAEKKYSAKHLAYGVAAVIFIIFAYRTVIRNSEWKNPETLAFATIKTSPLSVRPYNDVAGYYVMNHRLAEGKKYYLKALSIAPSIVAMNNLGFLYILYDLDPNINSLHETRENISKMGMDALTQKQDRMAMYYFNEAYRLNSNDPNLLNQLAIIYIGYGKNNFAHKYLDQSMKSKPTPDTFFVAGYLAFKEGKRDLAIQNLQTVLTLDPNHQGAKENLEYILKNP